MTGVPPGGPSRTAGLPDGGDGPVAMIALTDVAKVYAGGVTALAGVSLRIERGEAAAIVGPSGSG